MSRLIQATRARIGAPPRAATFLIPQPEWLGANDGLAAAYREHPGLLAHGELVPGYIPMANEAIFRVGTEICAGYVLHPRDPTLAIEVDELERVATAVSDIRSLEPADADQASFAALLKDEMKRCFSLPLPPALSRGRPLFLSTVILYRSALPQQRLLSAFLPVLVRQDRNEVAPLPVSFWARDLFEAWQDL